MRTSFNAVVRSKDTAVGAQVSTADRLAVLAGTDRFWIQVSLPTDRLEWITIPTRSGGAGSPVSVIYQERHRRDGQVVRLLGELAPEGRMAQLLVAVDDPLGLKGPAGRPPLLIGEFVRVEIQGRRLDGSTAFRAPACATAAGSGWPMKRTAWRCARSRRCGAIGTRCCSTGGFCPASGWWSRIWPPRWPA